MEVITEIDTIYIHLTRRCNLHCVYCYFKAGESSIYEELTSNEMFDIINEFSKLNLRRVIFTGGEPLLRNDVFELARHIKKVNDKVVLGITTNGILINQTNAKEIVQLFDEIRISIDGPELINDSLRGEGSFNKVIRAFECIINAGGNPSAFITVTTANFMHLKSFLNFLLDRGINKLHISPLKEVGRAENSNMSLDINFVKNLMDEFWFERFGLHLISRNNESFNCGVGRFISIHPDGSVFPCHVLAFPEFCIGNLKQESLSSIYYNSTLMKKLRNLHSSEISQCAECFKGLPSQNSCLGLHIQDASNRSELVDYINSKGE